MANSLSGFVWFLRNIVVIPGSAIADNSPFIDFSYNFALMVVNKAFQQIPIGGLVWSGQPVTAYDNMVYNLATDQLINVAVDTPSNGNYFENLRDTWKLNNFTAGVVQSSFDQGTGVTLDVIEAADTFTIDDIDRLKTPWGRAYVKLAMQYGSAWGISSGA